MTNATQYKSFKQFILDARGDTELPEEQREKLIEGLFKIIADPNYTDAQVETYLNDLKYETDHNDPDPQDYKKIATLHYSTKWFWDFKNQDY